MAGLPESQHEVRVGVLAVEPAEGDRIELSVFYRYTDGVVVIGLAPDETCAEILRRVERATLVVRNELAPHVCLHVEGRVVAEWTSQSTVVARLWPERWVTFD